MLSPLQRPDAFILADEKTIVIVIEHNIVREYLYFFTSSIK